MPATSTRRAGWSASATSSCSTPGIESTPTHGVVVVVANAGGAVDVTNVTTFGAVNTD